jgi:ubiquinone/menaquinone biosynthesis C-methylase UbiE
MEITNKIKRKFNREIGRIKDLYFKFSKANPNSPSLWNRIWTGKTGYGEMKEKSRIDLYKYIALLIPKQEINLLDMGCGDGEFLRHVNDKVKKNGIDFSRTGIEKARQKVKGNFYVGDINETGFNDSCFDIITIIETLEHVDNPEDTLRETKRLLKNGGKLIISVPHPEHDIRDIRAWPECYSLHLHSFDFESLKSLLLKLGFHSIEDKTTLDTLIIQAAK